VLAVLRHGEQIGGRDDKVIFRLCEPSAWQLFRANVIGNMESAGLAVVVGLSDVLIVITAYYSDDGEARQRWEEAT